MKKFLNFIVRVLALYLKKQLTVKAFLIELIILLIQILF